MNLTATANVNVTSTVNVTATANVNITAIVNVIAIDNVTATADVSGTANFYAIAVAIFLHTLYTTELLVKEFFLESCKKRESYQRVNKVKMKDARARNGTLLVL